MKQATTRIAVTICSINYLSQAKSLGDSLLQHNPDYRFLIGLVDKRSTLSELEQSIPYEIIEVDNIGIAELEEMYLKYNITELNTAVKPFFMHYLLQKFSDTATVVYFDPDILIYDRLSHLEEILTRSNIALTPHITAPVFDTHTPSEKSFLNTGIYNLGFIAVRRNDEVIKFLQWWMERLKEFCFGDYSKGLFVDQLWINFVPLFYSHVEVIRHPGYNMAYWNLQERNLSKNGSQYFVNENYPLVFYHFSGYQVDKEYAISKYQDRFSFKQRPDLVELFRDYSRIVMANGHAALSKIDCHYTKLKTGLLNGSQETVAIKKNRNGTIRQLAIRIKRIYHSIKH